MRSIISRNMFGNLMPTARRLAPASLTSCLPSLTSTRHAFTRLLTQPTQLLYTMY